MWSLYLAFCFMAANEAQTLDMWNYKFSMQSFLLTITKMVIGYENWGYIWQIYNTSEQIMHTNRLNYKIINLPLLPPLSHRQKHFKEYSRTSSQYSYVKPPA
jgi:hypothetical protein